MTQNELTLAINKSYNYINSVEQGKIMPSFEVIEQICDVLKIKPASLFDEDSSPANIKAFNKEDYIKGQWPPCETMMIFEFIFVSSC